jgi:hypothetical protein
MDRKGAGRTCRFSLPTYSQRPLASTSFPLGRFFGVPQAGVATRMLLNAPPWSATLKYHLQFFGTRIEKLQVST